ncbi:hypothetical protein NPIL_213751 [Nephila pilipes]|uniref:Uncharacterized protein n=1 Tax=Nephila pilipes TaxID=299642 RepID=A0A8X6P6P4_NEPPI|nr:hypothetical protein NPIL_213751 [Nephila pilipes]
MSNCKSLSSGWCQQHFDAVASERPALDLLGHDRMGYDGRGTPENASCKARYFIFDALSTSTAYEDVSRFPRKR